jgi:hypothetical protein
VQGYKKRQKSAGFILRKVAGRLRLTGPTV